MTRPPPLLPPSSGVMKSPSSHAKSSSECPRVVAEAAPSSPEAHSPVGSSCNSSRGPRTPATTNIVFISEPGPQSAAARTICVPMPMPQCVGPVELWMAAWHGVTGAVKVRANLCLTKRAALFASRAGQLGSPAQPINLKRASWDARICSGSGRESSSFSHHNSRGQPRRVQPRAHPCRGHSLQHGA